MSEFQTLKIDAPSGVNFSKEPSQLAPNTWDEADNVTFRHGKTFKVTGYEQGFGEALCEPSVIVPLRSDDNNHYWWTYAGTQKTESASGAVTSENKIYRILSKGVHEDVTPVGGVKGGSGFLEPLRWSGAEINGVPYVCYGKPYAWDVLDNNYVDMRKFPEHVNFRIMRTFRNYMIGLNFETKDYDGDYPQGFSPWKAGVHQNALWWSHEVTAGNIQPSKDWDEDPDPEASDYEKSMWCDADPTRNSGWNFLGGGGGPILEAKELRDNFIIYRERSVWQMSYIGGINVFAFKELFDDIGAFNEQCVVEIEGNHFVIGSSDIYMHNGVQKQSIVDGIVKSQIFTTIDPQYSKNVFLSVDYNNKEVWVCIPESYTNKNGACNVAYIYNWIEKTWSRRDIPDMISSVYTILDLPEEDVSWEAYEEGGPSKEDGTGNSIPGASWEESTDTWLDSYYKYNPSEWGLAMGSSREYREVVDDNILYKYRIYTSIEQPLWDGENFETVVEKKWLDMGDRSDSSFVSKIYPLIRKGYADIYMSGSRTIDEGVSWKYIGRFDPARDTKLSCRVSGQFIHVRFVIPKESRAEIRGYNLELATIGRRA